MLKTRTSHRFSVADYDRMIDTGILTENDRVELIRGEILDKMPIGDSHVACVLCLNRLFHRLVGDRAIVGIQSPIRLDDSEPEPDLTLVQPREDFYRSGKPRADDVWLLVEVSDSTLESDRELKLPIYAEAKIAEYWIVNLIDGCLEVYREPTPSGEYRSSRILRPGERIEPLRLPGVSVDVSDLFA